MIRRYPYLLAGAVLPVSTGAGTDPVSGAKAYFRGRKSDLHIPRLSVAVVRDGRIIMIGRAPRKESPRPGPSARPRMVRGRTDSPQESSRP